MFLADYHIHSDCSMDCHVPMEQMAAAAYERGCSQVLFTDHADFGFAETLQISKERPEMPRQQRTAYESALKSAPRGLEIRIGLELGEANHDSEWGKAVYSIPEYDFILGSLHALRDMDDFYYLSYPSAEYMEELYDRYLDELIELAGIDCFDVMAHIGYFVRYSHAQGLEVNLTMERSGDRIDTLFRTLIERGKGIELNCADLIPGGRSNPLLYSIPTLPILRRYRELGGEIVTVGSDAHTIPAAGLAIAEGCELLRQAGFRYVTAYKKHVAEFMPL